MSDWRVVRQWNVEYWTYTVEDVLPERLRAAGVLPLVQHQGAHSTPEQLKAELLAKLKAFEQPMLEILPPVIRPAVMREVGKTGGDST